MSISSMTGFARAEGGDESLAWVWEAKSVNNRGLDVRCRVPQGMDAIEAAARAAAAKRFSRGSLNLNLQITRADARAEYQVNRDFLDKLIELARDYQDADGVEKPRLDGLLSQRGVVETVEPVEDEDTQAAREKALLISLDEVMSALEASRQEEGARIAEVLSRQIDEIDALGQAARAEAAAQPDAIRARLTKQLEAIMDSGKDIDPQRLAQEAALLAVKSDIREEIDRLDAHVAGAREMLDAGGVIGRRLDFLSQEFNREANTLCSKAPDQAVTNIGLDLKTVIDRLREQVQNIE